MAATASGKDKLLRNARIFVGAYDLSGDARTVGTLENRFEPVDLTGWSEFVKNYVSDDLRQVGIRGFQALVNDTTGRAFDILSNAAAANAHIVSFCFGGGGEPAVPDPAYLLHSVQILDDMSFDAGSSLIAGDFLPTAANYSATATNPMGVVLQGATSLSSTTTGSSHDNAASSANGYHAHIHVLATSSGNFAFTIEHSSNDSAWATLATFTTTGGSITAERVTATGTVNRYVRAVSTRTAGTVTAVITFARN